MEDQNCHRHYLVLLHLVVGVVVLGEDCLGERVGLAGQMAVAVAAEEVVVAAQALELQFVVLALLSTIP